MQPLLLTYTPGPPDRPPPNASPDSPFRTLTRAELGAGAGDRRPWLWDGFLAPGNVTLLTGQWKTAGKTTLLSLLLARLNGGGTLAGQAVRPGRAVIVTEEDDLLWDKRGQKLNFGNEHEWICRPFRGLP